MKLPPRLEDSFAVAASELGQVTASWLFVEAVTRDWPEGAQALRDALGRSFPVLDAVAAQAVEGKQRPAPDVAAALRALEGCKKLVVVGHEASHLDPLLAALEGVQVGVILSTALGGDLERILANHRGQVELLTLRTFQAWAGAKSALLTFLYGSAGGVTHVTPEWLRALGPDTRTQFRSLVGWEVLGGALTVYPRWLEQIELSVFTELC